MKNSGYGRLMMKIALAAAIMIASQLFAAVTPLPDYGKGKFFGVVIHNDVLYGSVSFSVTANGRITAKMTALDGVFTFRGEWQTLQNNGVLQTMLHSSRGDKTLAASVSPAGMMDINDYTGLGMGFGHAVNKTAAAPFAGYYTAAIPIAADTATTGSLGNEPLGDGFLTVNAAPAATLRYSGRLPDGTAISGSSPFVVFSAAELNNLGFQETNPNAQHAAFAIYKSLYGRRGEVRLLGWIASVDHRIHADKSQWRYPGKSATLTEDRFVAAFNKPGYYSYMSPSAFPVGKAYARPVDFSGFAGGIFYSSGEIPMIDLLATPSTLKLDVPATGSPIKLNVNGSSGLITGSAKITIPSKQTATLKGVVIMDDIPWASGYYLVSDPDTGTYRLKRSRYFAMGTIM